MLAWLAVGLVAVLAATLLGVNSDAAQTDSQIAQGAAALPDGVPASPAEPAWTREDVPGAGSLLALRTAIVVDERGVTGLDPATGDRRWYYQRDNATVCGTTILDGAVVVLFRTTGRCNEIVAFEADTGQRRWFRNVGFRADATLTGSGSSVLAVTPTGGVTMLDSQSGSLRWRYRPPAGCRAADLAVGSSGVVVWETCSTGTTWLARYDLASGAQTWRVPPPAERLDLLGSESVVTMYDGADLISVDAVSGRVLRRAPLDVGGQPPAAVPGTIRSLPLIYAGGALLAIDPAGGEPLWSVPAVGLPQLGDFGMVVPEATAFVVRDPLTGLEVDRFEVSEALPEAAPRLAPEGFGPPALLRAARLGPILIAATPEGITAYR